MKWAHQLFKLFFRPSLSRNWLIQLPLGSVPGSTAGDELDRLDAFLKESARFSFAPPDQKSFRELVEIQEDKLFQTIISNPDQTNCFHQRDKLPIICDKELKTSLYLQDKQNQETVISFLECYTKTHTKFVISLQLTFALPATEDIATLLAILHLQNVLIFSSLLFLMFYMFSCLIFSFRFFWCM